MTYLVIKSNQGNHSGFNRKWELLKSCSSYQDAHSALVDYSLDLDDNHSIRNGRAYDSSNKMYIFTNDMSSFVYDGVTYAILAKDDVESFFDGGSNGYVPQFVIDEFNLESDD